MEITQFTMDEILDPTNIIEGKRYEFILDMEVDEDDELYHEAGIEVRILIAEKGEELFILNYFVMEKAEGEYLDFALEDEELNEILAFCKEELAKA